MYEINEQSNYLEISSIINDDFIINSNKINNVQVYLDITSDNVKYSNDNSLCNKNNISNEN